MYTGYNTASKRNKQQVVLYQGRQQEMYSVTGKVQKHEKAALTI